jgi:nucleotide-binding universal stress UspA family protein
MKRTVQALLVALAVALGLGGGLVYTWILDPVEYYDSAPDALDFEDKLVYLAVIGDIYTQDGDLARANAWLAKMDVPADGMVLAGFIEQYLDAGGQPEEVRNLARLAQDLGARGGVLLVFDTVSTPVPTPLPTRSAQAGDPPAAPPATATPVPGMRLVDRTAVCAAPGRQGEIAVWVQDAEGNDLPGIEVVVSWAQGQDRFFTGLRPDKGVGYADFEMKAGTEYDVTLAGFRGDAVEGLSSDVTPGICPEDSLAVSWHLIFERIPDSQSE